MSKPVPKETIHFFEFLFLHTSGLNLRLLRGFGAASEPWKIVYLMTYSINVFLDVWCCFSDIWYGSYLEFNCNRYIDECRLALLFQKLIQSMTYFVCPSVNISVRQYGGYVIFQSIHCYVRLSVGHASKLIFSFDFLQRFGAV